MRIVHMCKRFISALLYLNNVDIVQQLTLSVSDGIFVNPAGAAVVWSPAVPGSITDCSVRGNSAEAEAYYPSCVPSKTAGEWQQAPVNLTLLQDASDHVHEAESSTGSPSRGVIAAAVNSGAVSGPPDTLDGSEEAPIAHLQVHIPAEAYFMTTVIQEVSFHLLPASPRSAHPSKFDSCSCCVGIHCIANAGERVSRCASIADMAR